SLYDQLFEEENVRLVIAMMEDEPAGGMTVIETAKSVEIDSLFVREQWQRNGIGAAIQQFAMDLAGNRPVILVADADESPREMYQRQGYEYQTFQIGAQKELKK